MLRWANMRRMVRIPQRAYCTVNSSAVDEDVEASKESLITKPKVANQSKLVAAAFASLKELSINQKKRPSSIDIAIAKASNLNELLETAEGSISRSHALKIVTKLTDWACMGRIRLTDCENDTRFAKVCRLLGQSRKGDLLGDLSIVLGVTADEQAAKLVSSISFPQMIKVMSSLVAKKRRSPPLLRSLSFNIGRSSEVLSLKQAADVFYACAALNFHDEVLLAKVTADISASLKDNKIPSVVSSIAASAGIMKYRDTDLFEDLCNWMANNTSVCKAKEYISLVLALASINYIPEKFSRIYQHLKPYLKEQEMNKVNDWLDVVWSLVVLQRYGEDIIQSVLNPKFIDKLRSQSGDIHISTKMKLLNINGIAQQLASKYEGPLLPEDSDIYNLPLVRMKEKQQFVDCVKDTLSNIVNVPEYFKLDVNTGMGFLIDFECYLNEKSELISLSNWPNENGHKVAIMACMYHDVCRGSNEEITGIVALNLRLLENANYKVLMVPFYEFNTRDALINRVEYLRKKLKKFISK